MTQHQGKWYFEDFVTGDVIQLGQKQVTEEEVLRFATEFDPQSFHIDQELAKESIYGGIIASGWHTCGMIMRLIVDGYIGNSSSMGSPGVDEVRWLLPVKPGDTLTVISETLSTKASVSKPDRGIVFTQWKAINQRGETVCTIKGMGMFGRRPQA